MERRIFSREFTRIATRTLARMAKKASALTSQVVPKSRLKLTRLRVSRSMKADAQHEEVRAEAAQRRPGHGRRAGHGQQGEEQHEAERDQVVRLDRSACAGRGTASRRSPASAWFADRPEAGSTLSPGGGPPFSAATAGPSASDGLDFLEGAQDRRRAEGRLEHRIELGHQPRLAVVVVEDEDAVGGQVVAHRLEGLDGEQERLEPDVAGGADEGQRVGQGEDDQVVLLVGGAQEGPAVVDVARDPRIVVGMQGVMRHADLLDGRVDLDGVDVAGAVAERDRDVVARCRRRRSGPPCRSGRGTTCRSGSTRSPCGWRRPRSPWCGMPSTVDARAHRRTGSYRLIR